MHGFQLWANLPAALKMTAPRYQEVKAADIPVITDDDGTHVRIVCGSFWGRKDRWTASRPSRSTWMYRCRPGAERHCRWKPRRHAFAYVFAGAGKFCNASGPLAVPTESVGWLDKNPPSEADNRSLVVFDRGDEVAVQAGRRRYPLPAGLRKAAGGAGGVVRPDCHEHTGRATDMRLKSWIRGRS